MCVDEREREREREREVLIGVIAHAHFCATKYPCLQKKKKSSGP